MSIEKQVYVPTLKWHQSMDYVYITFEVHNSKNENIVITEHSIYFNVLSSDYNYEMNFELYDSIDKNSSKYTVDEKCVKVVLKKLSSDNWSFLTKNRNIYRNNIKVNWAEWVDYSDDEESKEKDPQFDFQKMMQSMGGMGNMEEMMKNMGGMGNMEEMMQGMGGDEDTEGLSDEENANESNHSEDCEECEHCESIEE